MSIAFSPSSIRYGAAALAAAAAVAVAGCGSAASSSSSRSVAAAPTATTTTTSTTSSHPTAAPSSTTSSSTATSSATSPSPAATGKGFVAAIPAGFRNATGSAQGGPINILYLAIGPRAGTVATNINVVREPAAGLTNINAIVQDELRGLKRISPDTHPIVSAEPVTVDGEPARALEYLHGPPTQRLHLRQVIAEHQDWIYVITYTASPAAYATSLPALTQMISSWHWTSR